MSGVASYCTANEIVLRALIRNAKNKNRKVLIEATSNQVNQDFGYTGMNPFDFTDYIDRICKDVGLDRDMVILGGDHLGPLPWSDLDADKAMDKAETLVRMYTRAGFKKIHIDTTMKLNDDPSDRLDDAIIAKRAARLYKACEEEFSIIKSKNPDEEHPIFVIGSEVPYAGGIRDENENVVVTNPQEFDNTLAVFHRTFEEEGIQGAWEHIIAIVVPPGVDFGANRLQVYDRSKSKELCKALRKYPGLVFEGHSTDFQSKAKLKEMVEDGIAVLKVGPALTFALREILYALSFIEDLYYDEDQRSNIRSVLDKAMVENDKNWKKYYFGTDAEMKALRSYGLSDRCRYYLMDGSVDRAIKKLIRNMSKLDPPMGVLHQFLPIQYKKIRNGELPMDMEAIIDDHIIDVVSSYEYATDFKYIGE